MTSPVMFCGAKEVINIIDKIVVIEILNEMKLILDSEDWKRRLKKYISKVKKNIHFLSLNNNQEKALWDELKLMRILEILLEFIEKNYLFLAKRLIEREIDNINGTTQEKCKRHKINKQYCEMCLNINCDFNKKKDKEDNQYKLSSL